MPSSHGALEKRRPIQFQTGVEPARSEVVLSFVRVVVQATATARESSSNECVRLSVRISGGQPVPPKVELATVDGRYPCRYARHLVNSQAPAAPEWRD